MSHQDCRDIYTNREALKEVFAWLLPAASCRVQRHGNAVLTPRVLAAKAIICWGWLFDRTLSARLETATKVAGQVLEVEEGGTRQGICKALAGCGDALLQQILQQATKKIKQLKGCWRTAGAATFAVDGSKFAAPRTAQNQAAFAPNATNTVKKYRTKADASKAETVQVLLTIFWHIGSGLPFRWRLAPSSGSERNSALEMLGQLPAKSRIVGDAEYIGYPFWSAIVQSNQSFVVRVGSNVRFIRKLGYARHQRGLVYYWPCQAMQRLQEPLILRLVEIHNGRHPLWLVTNEFALSDKQLREIYQARWGVEVFFRTVKQNCGRAKMVCRTPDNVLTELNWMLLGVWAALFQAKLTLKQNNIRLDRLSPIRVFDALASAALDAIGQGSTAPALDEALKQALKQDETRRQSSKDSRNYPKKKRWRPCGKPKINDATPEQIAAAQQLKKISLPA